jgi:hypothetical protein
LTGYYLATLEAAVHHIDELAMDFMKTSEYTMTNTEENYRSESTTSFFLKPQTATELFGRNLFGVMRQHSTT